MQRNLDALANQSFDLLVLGGGITGAGVAVDAALRGFRVALLDKGDFGSGTSSVSSKLVHGGLRYLEHGHLHLVYEALHERRLLLRNAPHLVRPLRFVVPFYRGTRVPSWQWRLGLGLYDLLAGAGNLAPSRSLHARRLRREIPGLSDVGLYGGAAYHDAQMEDARLCLVVVRTAALQGACVANYVEAVGFEQTGGTIRGVQAVDRVTGRSFTVHAQQVLNATGPWVDTVCRLAGDTQGPHLRPTRGVHLLAPDRGLTAALLLLHPDDGRVFFVIPWLGKTLIGTTDTVDDESPDGTHAQAGDVDYLLRGFNHYLSPNLQVGELLSVFAGLRPLLRSRPGEPSSLSREFRVFASSSGLLSVAGGKYTTYRHMAEVVTDAVAERLGRRRPCRTRRYRLDGAPPGSWPEFVRTQTLVLHRDQGLSEATARHLVERYGQRSRDVAGYLTRDPAGAEPVLAGEPDLRGEFLYQREQEMALYPDDCLVRRTRLGLLHPELLRQTPSW